MKIAQNLPTPTWKALGQKLICVIHLSVIPNCKDYISEKIQEKASWFCNTRYIILKVYFCKAKTERGNGCHTAQQDKALRCFH